MNYGRKNVDTDLAAVRQASPAKAAQCGPGFRYTQPAAERLLQISSGARHSSTPPVRNLSGSKIVKFRCLHGVSPLAA